jgi:ribonuclease R
MGADTGLTIGIGQRVTVRLVEAVPVTGGLMLELLDLEDRPLPGGRTPRGKAPRRAAGRSEIKRRVVRRRR